MASYSLRGRVIRPLFLVFLLNVAFTRSLIAEETSNDFFEKEIRPLLINKCSECHTGSQNSGGLSLESRSDLLKGGESGNAIDLDKPHQSLLLSAVRRSGELKMPPEESLSKKEIDALAMWIKLKAPWPEKSRPILSSTAERARSHWAFQPIRRPPVPKVTAESQCRNPIDAFIQNRLRKAGLEPAPEADKRTLIRRAYYTLTGLPPSPDRVARFLEDKDEDAYENLIDELLGSPQYGEHWARHWLDVARYSDTKGYVYAREERTWVHAWTYRNWVVRALNEDMPFDHFLKLQIAADQVANKRKSDLAAMGFLTLGRRFLGVPWEIIDDRIDTLSRGTMGLTVSCARCHDHKYDPIPTADYYSLYGVFASSREELVGLETSGVDQSFEQELEKRTKTLKDRLAQAREESSQRVRTRVRDYLQAQTELDKYPAQGFDQIFSKDDLLPTIVRRWQYYLHQAELKNDRIFIAWRMYRQIPTTEFAARSAAITEQLNSSGPERVNPLVKAHFQTPPKTFAEVIDRYGQVLKEIDTSWHALLQNNNDKQVTQFDDPDREELRAVLYGPRAPAKVPNLPLVHTETFFDTDTINKLWKLQGEVDRWIINAPQPVAYSVILKDRKIPFAPRILRRGDPVNYGDDVPRQFLSLFKKDDTKPFRHGSGRRELADAIVDSENPLTARVIANRMWMHHFGDGLVTTPSDFGLRASPPSHPLLLDWLASELVRKQWSLKSLHRLMLLSHTFRQSSEPYVDKADFRLAKRTDPENRLLWKMNQHRLTFEEMRDSFLSVADNLNPVMYGKPNKLFEAPYPTHRSIYGMIDRQFLPNTLRVFDFANPDLHIPKRSETTVPQQSLFLMNHPLVLEHIKAFTEFAKRDTKDPIKTVKNMFQLAFQRPPSQREVSESLAFVEQATQTEAIPISPTVADWKYGYGTYDGDKQSTAGFTLLPYFNGQAWQGGPKWPDAKLGWVQLTATGGHPGNDQSHACVRRWTAPRKLNLHISSTLINEPAAGDGIQAFVVSSNKGLLKQIKNHQQPTEVNVESISVEQGETIDFIVDINRVLNSDQFLWEITLSEIDGDAMWNSKNDFPQDIANQLDGWEQLAQAILCTNEFLFLD